MTYGQKSEPRLLPPDVLEGYARRLSDSKIPVNKLPEILELRAIGRSLLAHIAALRQGVAGA